MAALEQLLHVPIEKGQHERADVRPVDVGVGHHDDPVVAKPCDVELVPDARTDRGDHRLNLGIREHLVDAVLLAVDDLATQRQDRLVRAVAPRLRGTARRVALDDEQLSRLGVADRAVGELARQR